MKNYEEYLKLITKVDSNKVYTSDIDIKAYSNPGKDFFSEKTRTGFMKTEFSKKVRENAISIIEIKIDSNMYNNLLSLAKSLEYSDFYQPLGIALSPKNEIVEEVLDIFLPIRNYVISSHFTKILPNGILPPHVDNIRGTAIYLPLFQNDLTYSPFEIYFENEIYAITKNSKPCFYAWNSQLLHAVYNNENTRYNFQITIEKPYNEMIKIIDEIYNVR